MKKTIYVRLLNEGTDCFRPVNALEVECGKYEIIATDGYDPTNEEWEFPPGTVVVVKEHLFSDEHFGLLAISPAYE